MNIIDIDAAKMENDNLWILARVPEPTTEAKLISGDHALRGTPVEFYHAYERNGRWALNLGHPDNKQGEVIRTLMDTFRVG